MDRKQTRPREGSCSSQTSPFDLSSADQFHRLHVCSRRQQLETCATGPTEPDRPPERSQGARRRAGTRNGAGVLRSVLRRPRMRRYGAPPLAPCSVRLPEISEMSESGRTRLPTPLTTSPWRRLRQLSSQPSTVAHVNLGCVVARRPGPKSHHRNSVVKVPSEWNRAGLHAIAMPSHARFAARPNTTLLGMHLRSFLAFCLSLPFAETYPACHSPSLAPSPRLVRDGLC